MSKPSVKTIIIWVAVLLFVIGSIVAGGPFDLIGIVITRPIMNIMFVIFNLVSSIGWDFGGAIIIFAVLVKLCMWPLTKSQLKQTRLMRKIQPELVQIRKNCNGNKQLESLQTMDLYKRYNVKPFASFLVLLIQLPIFIAVVWAINVLALTNVQSNYTINDWAYPAVVWDGSEMASLKEKQEVYLADLADENIPDEEKAEYDFHPTLGAIDLTARASDVISPTKFSGSAVFMMVIAVMAAVAQYIVAKQQMPSGKSEKHKKFRELIKEANEGKEIDQSEISNLSTAQMSKMMPIMMFIIMISLHGALAFYYFVSNMLTILQQKINLKAIEREMDDNTDRAMTRELKKIQEAEVIENKKTGTRTTRIKARDVKAREAKGDENGKGGKATKTNADNTKADVAKKKGSKK